MKHTLAVLVVLILATVTARAESLSGPTDPVAQYNLALEYADPKSDKYNMQQALFWFEKAGKKGHIGAQKEVGDIYRYGKGVDKDTVRALNWYQMPTTYIVSGLKTYGVNQADLDAMKKASIELMVAEKKARDAQPKKDMTAYELGEAIGTVMKATQDSTAKYSNISTPDAPSHLSPATRACREEAMKYIIECKKVTDYLNCEMWGCPEIIECDDRLTKCDDHGSPYNTSNVFYCDKRNWRTRDESLEVLLQDTCGNQ